MNHFNLKKLCRVFGATFVLFSILYSLYSGGGIAVAATPPSRAGNNIVAAAQNARANMSAGTNAAINPRNAVTSVATPVGASRSAVATPSVRQSVMPARSVRNSRAAVSSPSFGKSRAAISRAAVPAGAIGGSARSAISVSRAATNPRAAAPIYSDTTVLGTGYTQCRTAYGTCMDQFCSDVAESSDTKKRCICSARWETIHSRRDDLSTARGLIQQFTDNNITAVGMSAEEVAAQYAATAGEMAIGERSSASAALDQISDLLSGTGDTANRNQPVGLININDMFSAFDFDGGGDTVGQTGQQLFDTASRQCLNLVSDVCPSDSAATTMVRNAYSVMIDNACTVMERDNDTEKEKVLSAVRELNKALMSERLKEYRSHNSASVNQCIDRVKMEIQSDSACGENYMRCLDFTGLYINATTGEPIYTPRLFQLANQIKLEDMSSRETQQFMAGLETYKNRVTATLDTCRDDAELVWNEFKTQALIEIAQAQDEKLEEIKGSCISTMKTCYDTQTGAMRDFDDTSAQASGALAARASRAMCQNQVAACANLYADPNNSNCAAPDSANLSNTTGSNVCGLQALLNFVNTVDDIRIQEGCAESLQNHADDLCKPGIGDTNEWPYGCRKLTPDALKSNLVNYAKLYCSENQADIPEDSWIIETINDKVDEIYEVLDAQMSQICRGLDGAWIYRPDPLIPWVQSSINPGPPANNAWNTRFVSTVFGNAAPYEPGESWGACVENSAAIRCKLADDKTPEIDGDASWDSTLQECNYELTWYQAMCENYLGGTWDGGTGTCGYI